MPPTMPDLAAFKVVAPNQDVRVEDLTMPDGTKMVGPDGLLIPPARNFSMIVNSATRVYSYRFDEAMRDNFVAARAMRRDAFLLGLLEERILPTINREWSLEVDDDRDPEQQFVRDGLNRIVRNIRNFDAMKRALLDAVWFGRAGVGWSFKKQEEVDNLWGIGKWDPVHGDSVQMSFDGHPCILMDAQTAAWYTSHGAKYGPPGVGDLVPTDRGGTALQLHRPNWRERYAIHQHILQKADYFEGEMAGSVQGFGLRGQVYWQYVVRTDALTWMLAYMQAVGQMDLLVFNYPTGNAAAQRQQEINAQQIIGKAAIACPRDPKGNWPAVEQIPMNSAGLTALQGLVADYFDRHIERLIVGQSMSSGADKGTGLGGTGRADFARATKDEILVYDANRLDQTLTYDLLAPLKKYNFPWAKFPVRFKSILPDLKAQEKVMSGKVLVSIGVPIKADEFREAAGYSRPEPGDDVIGAPQQGPPGGAPGAAPPGGAPAIGGGGQAPPAWMGAPSAAPAMLARGQNPTRYMGMASPGGSNTHIPKFDKTQDIGFTRYALGFVGTKFQPLQRLIDQCTRRELEGIKISYDETDDRIHFDVTTKGDPDVAKPLIAAAKKIVGASNVEVVHNGPRPFGRNWETLYGREASPVAYGPPYKACSTQIDLAGEAAIRVMQASSNFPQDVYADNGRELNPHVTLRYGIAADPGAVAKAVGKFGPIRFRLGRADVFHADARKDYDVITVVATGDDLFRLNRILKTLPGTDTYPDYKPHATVACVRSGMGEEYAARIKPLNLDITVDGFFFCDTNGGKTWISTTGKPAGPVWIDNRDNPQDVQYRGGVPTAYTTPSERNALRDKRTAAQARFRSNIKQLPATELAARILEHVRTVGPMTQSKLASKLNMDSATFLQGANHAVEQGHLEVEERPAHANGGGRTARVWKPKEQPPTQASRYARPGHYTDREGMLPDQGLPPPPFIRDEQFLVPHDPNLPQDNLGPAGDQWRPGPTSPQEAAVNPGAPQDSQGRTLTQSVTPDDAPVLTETAQLGSLQPIDLDYSDPQAFSRSVAAAMGAHGRDEAESRARGDAGAAVVQNIPPAAYERLAAGRLKSVVSHPDIAAVSAAWADTHADPNDEPDQAVEGFYDPETGTATVNGEDPAGVFAHEIGHALDWSQAAGPGGYYQLSSTDEWKRIWRTYFASGALSDYARTDPAEGFAEFARLMYSDPQGPVTASKHFLKALLFFEKYGLV